MRRQDIRGENEVICWNFSQISKHCLVMDNKSLANSGSFLLALQHNNKFLPPSKAMREPAMQEDMIFIYAYLMSWKGKKRKYT